MTIGEAFDARGHAQRSAPGLQVAVAPGTARVVYARQSRVPAMFHMAASALGSADLLCLMNGAIVAGQARLFGYFRRERILTGVAGGAVLAEYGV